MTDNAMTSAYDDIIDREYTGINSRTRMSMEARAAQFAPFAALPLQHKGAE